MTKKIAIINDLSGFGRCSLTAAISVISSMGIQACPLPTAILSSQTGYPSYSCLDLTDNINQIKNEWEKLSPFFDVIYSGFVSHEKQIDEILSFVDTFHNHDNVLLVDPIMGDDGITYDMFSDTLKEKMIHLSKQANIITPNLTELCILTSYNYEKLISITDPTMLLNKIEELAYSFLENKKQQMIVTGIRYLNKENKPTIGNSYFHTKSDHFSFPDIGGSYSGTGDLFASCIAGGIAKGLSVNETIKLATNFLFHAIEDSNATDVPCIEGVNFEKYLHLLSNIGKEK